MTRILFVCLGNICRSPIAEAVFRQHVTTLGVSDQYGLDSAGTGACHIGGPADSRGIAACAEVGIDLNSHRARQVQPSDFMEYDYLIGMDQNNLQTLRGLEPTQCRAKLALMMDFCDADTGQDIPDPYYGDDAGFDLAIELCQRASAGLHHYCQSRGTGR